VKVPSKITEKLISLSFPYQKHGSSTLKCKHRASEQPTATHLQRGSRLSELR